MASTAGSFGKLRRPWLVTGANGFVGRAFCDLLHAEGIAHRAVVRQARRALAGEIALGDFATADWREVLAGVDCVFHLAARAHVMEERAADPLAEYRRANVEVSARLADQAAAAGVRRFVFLSTVKVLGEYTRANPFTDADAPAPQDDYAKSKLEAEEVLAGIGRLRGMEVLILRVPLIHGPEVKGNFLTLLKWVARGIPLPLGAIRNQRSLLYLANLCHALRKLGELNQAHSGCWLLADPDPISTPALARGLAQALGVPSRVFPLPGFILTSAAAILGREAAWERLHGSLVVDARRFCREFDWTPPFTLQQGLAETAAWYRRRILG